MSNNQIVADAINPANRRYNAMRWPITIRAAKFYTKQSRHAADWIQHIIDNRGEEVDYDEALDYGVDLVCRIKRLEPDFVHACYYCHWC